MESRTLESLDLVAAVEAVPHPAWLCDDRGRIIHPNERWLRYFGNESALRPHWLTDRFIHLHDVDAVRSAWRIARETGTDLHADLRLRRFDGTWRWHTLRAAPIYDHGPSRGWLGTVTDIDETVEAARRSIVRSEMLEAQCEAAIDATILVSPDRRLIWANQRAYDLWGATREAVPPGSDMRAAALATAMQTADPEGHMAMVDRMYAEPDRVLHDEVEMVDGRTMERYSAPVIDIHGIILGRVNTYRDVTENRHLLLELQDRARTAVVLNYVADAVVLVDLQGVVRLWNPAAETLTGVSEATAVGRHVSDVIPGWNQVRTNIPVFASGGPRTSPATLPLELANGGEAWVSIIGVRFDEGTVFALRDVTDDRRLDRMRSDIVATVSHELRTPLTSIYGMAITLQRTSAEVDAATRRQLLGMVVDQAGRLGEIIDDILVASSLEAGSLSVRTAPVDMEHIVRGALDGIAQYLPPTVQVSVEVDAPGVHAIADPGRVQQVLANLLENAIKYSPDGGDVHLRIARQRDDVLIEVMDQGLGIPAAEIDHVFEKFHRLDPKMSRGIAGTGLGLYIARELARRMDGDVIVVSAPGQGSTFTLRLPAA